MLKEMKPSHAVCNRRWQQHYARAFDTILLLYKVAGLSLKSLRRNATSRGS